MNSTRHHAPLIDMPLSLHQLKPRFQDLLASRARLARLAQLGATQPTGAVQEAGCDVDDALRRRRARHDGPNAFVEAMNGLQQQSQARRFRTGRNFIAIAYLRLSKLKHLPAHLFAPAPAK